MNDKQGEEMREPRAGDVRVSKRMTRMVMRPSVQGEWLIEVETSFKLLVKIQLLDKNGDFRRWARTAKLVARGK